MAVTMKSTLVWATLGNIVSVTSGTYQKAKYLEDHGATLSFGLFTFSVTLPETSGGKVLSDTLPQMPSKFSTLSTSVQGIIAKKVSHVIESALKQMHIQGPVGALPDTVAPPFPDPVKVPEAKAAPDWMSVPPPAKEVAVAKKAAAKPTPSASVLKLKDARALGQKVKGTSGSSVYRTVAVGPLNVAIKGDNGSLSIRAEFQDARDLKVVNSLKQMGFTDNDSYLSMHMHTSGSLPMMRVVGAVVMGIGTQFEQVATTQEQVNG